jgi:hypothetical protein
VESVSGVVGQDDGLTGGQSTSGMPMIPERLTDSGQPKKTNSGNYPLHSGNYAATIDSISQFPQEQTPHHLQPYYELQGTGDFASDDMWKKSSLSDPISTAQTGIHSSLISTGKWLGWAVVHDKLLAAFCTPYKTLFHRAPAPAPIWNFAFQGRTIS